jgi:hypothetical protein
MYASSYFVSDVAEMGLQRHHRADQSVSPPTHSFFFVCHADCYEISATHNQMALHSLPGCFQSVPAFQTGIAGGRKSIWPIVLPSPDRRQR